MLNFNSIGSGVSEPQVAENRHLPLTGGIALTTVYALTCYTVIQKRPFIYTNFPDQYVGSGETRAYYYYVRTM